MHSLAFWLWKTKHIDYCVHRNSQCHTCFLVLKYEDNFTDLCTCAEHLGGFYYRLCVRDISHSLICLRVLQRKIILKLLKAYLKFVHLVRVALQKWSEAAGTFSAQSVSKVCWAWLPMNKFNITEVGVRWWVKAHAASFANISLRARIPDNQARGLFSFIMNNEIHELLTLTVCAYFSKLIDRSTCISRCWRMRGSVMENISVADCFRLCCALVLTLPPTPCLFFPVVICPCHRYKLCSEVKRRL